MKSKQPIIISFIGLDGAGKSTYVSRVGAQLAARGQRVDCVYLGYGEHQSGLMRWVVSWRRSHTRSVLRPFMVLAYLGLLPWEFAVRVRGHRGDVLLTDRHPLYEPVSESTLGTVLTRILVAIAPTPDIVFFLSGTPEVLWARKHESTLAEYLERAQRLERTVRSRAARLRTIDVDTTSDLDGVVRKLMSEIPSHA